MLLGYVMSEAPTPRAPAVHVLTVLANFAAFAIELGEPLPKSCMELITAIGDKQEERHIPTAACQVQQKVQAEVVTPMDVLHHEEHGVSCRLIGKEMSHGSEEPSLLFFWINNWRRGKGRHVGEEQRQVWQQKGELSRVSSETLLEAANAYIDLLTAMTGEAIARDIEKDLRDLLRRADQLASQEPGAKVDVRRVTTALLGQRQALAKLHSQVAAATAKLVYVLGIDPCTALVPVDQKLVAIDLIDASPREGLFGLEVAFVHPDSVHGVLSEVVSAG